MRPPGRKKMGAASHDDRIVPAKQARELKKTASIISTERERARKNYFLKAKKQNKKEEEEEEINDLYGGHERAWHRTIVRCFAGPIGSSSRLKLY